MNSMAWPKCGPNEAVHPLRAFLPLLIVRELFFATKIEARDAGKLAAATDLVAAKTQAYV